MEIENKINAVVLDGHAISLLREIGIKIAFIKAEKTGFAKVVCERIFGRAVIFLPKGVIEALAIF